MFSKSEVKSQGHYSVYSNNRLRIVIFVGLLARGRHWLRTKVSMLQWRRHTFQRRGVLSIFDMVFVACYWNKVK